MKITDKTSEAEIARDIADHWLQRMAPDAPGFSTGTLVGELAADITTLALIVSQLAERQSVTATGSSSTSEVPVNKKTPAPGATSLE